MAGSFASAATVDESGPADADAAREKDLQRYRYLRPGRRRAGCLDDASLRRVEGGLPR